MICSMVSWEQAFAMAAMSAAFKDGDVRFMICTDVAARGLDIKELPFVINVTLPDKARAPRHILRGA